MPDLHDPKWFETWFDSPHYHKLYGHRSQGEAQGFISHLHGHMGWSSLDLLDLACGQGRHAAAAAQLGHHVVGIDLSPNSIVQAKTIHQSEENLSFQEGDMRTFDAGQSFDGVLNLFTSFGYFDEPQDQLTVLKQIKKHLRPGGFLILDFLNLNKSKNQLVPEEIIARSGTTYRIQREFGPFNPTMKGFTKTIAFEEGGQTHTFQERVAGLDKNTLETMLSQTGFSMTECFGDYDLSPWHSENSPRLILSATAQ
ncbi:class I SAM-dependent methyltransferase [Flavobacteriales bacterium]|nr:class I SAM-dependent methyltransferase [Flavobacteriales bacterium]